MRDVQFAGPVHVEFCGFIDNRQIDDFIYLDRRSFTEMWITFQRNRPHRLTRAGLVRSVDDDTCRIAEATRTYR